MMGPYEINDALEACILDLDRIVGEIFAAAEDKVAKQREFSVARARARIEYRRANLGRTPKVTVDEIDDHATMETADTEQAYNDADELLKALGGARRAAEAKMDALRTMAAGIRGAGG